MSQHANLHKLSLTKIYHGFSYAMVHVVILVSFKKVNFVEVDGVLAFPAKATTTFRKFGDSSGKK